MAINKVDYDVLTTGVSVYSNQAGAIDDVIKTLVNMNASAVWFVHPSCNCPFIFTRVLMTSSIAPA